MKLVLSFLRGHTIYALILLLAVFVIGVELVRPGTVTPLGPPTRSCSPRRSRSWPADKRW
jgi:hypothetical protein